ncbi:hypothetical protein EVAR_18778_1 [Eumeta japonica]|uniref:Reverse transcriptase domain-containing protein n=1 Tax=Eumeta variegata TaxID=151549 RepID=A0A4C1UMI3_EUMVA|nr:hypothetical protein EVAR_18778_1 [Eumeta japonica]
MITLAKADSLILESVLRGDALLVTLRAADGRGADVDLDSGVGSFQPNITWEGKGINIDGKYLNNLRFADDIVLFSTSSKQLEEMLTDLTVEVEMGWRHAADIMRTTGERWTKLVTTWKGPKGKRARGRPIDRWTDDLRKVVGDNWIEAAGDRAQWRQLEEAYTRGGP